MITVKPEGGIVTAGYTATPSGLGYDIGLLHVATEEDWRDLRAILKQIGKVKGWKK